MKTLADLTPEERDEAALLLANLRSRGYVDRERFNELVPGARVRHRGHQYPEAYPTGTGVVVGIVERPDSAWSQSWRMPDIEMVVAWDRPAFLGASRLSTVAQYHVYLVRVDTETNSFEAREGR